MRTIIKKIVIVIMAISSVIIYCVPVEASSKVTVINETGYYLNKVKYVQIVDENKYLVDQITGFSNGSSHTFSLQKSGNYVVYISFTTNDRTVYAKGNNYYISDGVWTLTISEIIWNEDGNSIEFINKDEFDSI